MNTLKINGTTLTGIYVDAAVSFNKPAKRVTTFTVPGRNGSLVIDEGTFDNVLISYPVYEKDTFPAEFDNLVNWLASLEGYQRIECSNDPGHYRLGRFVVPQTPTAKRLNRDGFYTLTFDCKPQRYLLSGEVDTDYNANPSETYTGAVASFVGDHEDVISDLKAAVTPVQNLNGQSSPYPAGGGKNLSPLGDVTSASGGGVTEANGTIYANIVQGTTYTLSFDMLVAQNTDLSEGNRLGVWLNNTGTAIIRPLKTTTGRQTVTFTASGNGYINFWCGAGAYSANTKVIGNVQLELGSAATAYAPYSNICPISGFTGANIVRTGKNLFDLTPHAVSSAVVMFGQTSAYWAENALYFKAGTYTLSLNKTQEAYLYFGTSSIIKATTSTAANTLTFTVPKDGYYSLWAYISNISESAFSNVMVELGSTATTYEPYNGSTITYDWTSTAGTVYGGTLNVTTGVLTVTHGMVDLGALNWNSASVNGRAYSTAKPSGAYIVGSNAGVARMVSNTYPVLAYYKTGSSESESYAVDKTMAQVALGSVNGQIFVHDLSFANYTEEQVKTALTGVQLVYELATPITYQLTPIEVSTLLGQNNIWADTGDVEVVVTSAIKYINPGCFPSKPLIRVYGSGTLKVNDNIITIAAHSQPYIDIDSELEECYCGDTNMNSYVTLTDHEFPIFIPGNNYITMGAGITKLGITPRWWEL